MKYINTSIISINEYLYDVLIFLSQWYLFGKQKSNIL